MLDIIDPTEPFSVFDFREMTMPTIENLWDRSKVPILC